MSRGIGGLSLAAQNRMIADRQKRQELMVAQYGEKQIYDAMKMYCDKCVSGNPNEPSDKCKHGLLPDPTGCVYYTGPLVTFTKEKKSKRKLKAPVVPEEKTEQVVEPERSETNVEPVSPITNQNEQPPDELDKFFGEKKCHECSGTGNIVVDQIINGQKIGEYETPCPECGGSGK